MNLWLEELTTIPDFVSINRALEAPCLSHSAIPIQTVRSLNVSNAYHHHQHQHRDKLPFERDFERQASSVSTETYSYVGFSPCRPNPAETRQSDHPASSLSALHCYPKSQYSPYVLTNRSENTNTSYPDNCTYKRREEPSPTYEGHPTALDIHSPPKYQFMLSEESREPALVFKPGKKSPMTSLEKKQRHLQSEQKRRSNFRTAMFTLRSLLPQGLDRQFQMSHREVLRSAILLMKGLQEHNAKLKRKLARCAANAALQ